jgi:glycosyltransferase involved in cell wall biosynthesis
MRSQKFGGLERYFVELSHTCLQKGYRSIFQYDLLPWSSSYLQAMERSGGKIILASTMSNKGKGLLSVIILLLSCRPAIVVSHFLSNRALFIVATLSRMIGVKKIITFYHNVPPLIKKPLARFGINLHHHILAVSDAVANQLSYSGIDQRRISTHYLGLFGSRNLSEHARIELRKQFGIEDQQPVLACIAWDNPIKGIDILLDAVKTAFDKRQKLHVLIIGIDPDKSRWPEYVDRMGLSGYIHWAGIKDDGWWFLNVADIYVQSSRSEGLCLSILEAMAMKLPVISTPVGGVPEVVIHNKTGYLAERATPEHLADAIIKLASQPHLWKPMGEAGHKRYLLQFKGDDSVSRMAATYFAI